MAWKKQLLDQAAELFEDGRSKGRDELSAKEAELYEQISRLKTEVECLKRNLLFYATNSAKAPKLFVLRSGCHGQAHALPRHKPMA
ncbi:MAG TPA: hypothetical protein VG826_25950 [Pirellulales bacterium]|nr:hypothetical protein [Pirellulales bacterium]